MELLQYKQYSTHYSLLLSRAKNNMGSSSIVYVGHLPHGFYEREMYEYFSQFGKVKKVRVARSAKTGRSRGYGYVQFKESSVAEVAASTMDNYLMYEKILKCHVVPDNNEKLMVGVKPPKGDDYYLSEKGINKKVSKKVKKEKIVNEAEREKRVENKKSRMKKEYSLEYRPIF